jgi:hypothetical protein
MYHTVNLRAQFVKEPFDDWCIGTGRRKYELSCIDRCPFYRVGEPVLTTIHELCRHCVVVALRIVRREVFRKDVMTSRGESVGTHTTIVVFLVGSLTGRRKTHNDVSRTDIRIVDHITAFHATGNGGVNDNGAYEVAHVSGLTACRPDADTHLTELSEQFVSAVDDG